MIIDPDNLDFHGHKRELILHGTEDPNTRAALSPNNCAFLISKNEKNLLFYLTCLVLFEGKVVKLMISQ